MPGQGINFKFTETLKGTDGALPTVPIAALMQKKPSLDVLINFSVFSRVPEVVTMTDDGNGGSVGVSQYADLNPENFLLGPTDANVKILGLPGDNKVIFDYITKKPFSNFEVSTSDSTTIFLGAQDIASKYLVSSDDLGNKTILTPAARFSYTVSGNNINCSEHPGPITMLEKNPLTNFDCYVPQNTKYTSWKPRFRVCQEIVGKSVVNFSGGKTRHSIVTDEEVKVLKGNLIQLEERDIINTDGVNNLGNNYYNGKDTANADTNIYFNKEGIIIESYDLARGLLLLKNPVPEDLLVTYRVDQSAWKEININFNPLIEATPEFLELQIDTQEGTMHYRRDNSIFPHNASSNDPLLHTILQPDLYKKVAQITPKFADIDLIDIRRTGGMLDKEAEALDTYDLDSHTSYGFLGVNPTQLNVVAVHLPDSVLQELIEQFSDITEAASWSWDWTNERMSYINFIRTTIHKTTNEWDSSSLEEDDLLNENPIKEEILQNITRHLSAGVVALVYDKENNLIFVSNK